jgi:hypothetical protein
MELFPLLGKSADFLSFKYQMHAAGAKERKKDLGNPILLFFVKAQGLSSIRTFPRNVSDSMQQFRRRILCQKKGPLGRHL